MNLGRRARVSIPKVYKGFRLWLDHGRLFGVPLALATEEDLDSVLLKHPAVLHAATLEELQQLIERDELAATPTVIGHCAGYDMVRHRGALYGVPHGATVDDWDLPEDRRRSGVLSAESLPQLEALIRAMRDAAPVEFAGWLPIYKTVGDCGHHPQFGHIEHSPPGYRFTYSAPPLPSHRLSRPARAYHALRQAVNKVCFGAVVAGRMVSSFVRPRQGVSVRARWRVFAAMVRLFAVLLARGCKRSAILGFLQTRNLQSQLLLGDSQAPVFLTSVPFTFGQRPWVIEIEDVTTLFVPMVHNGHTADVDIAATPCFPIVKALLEADNCKAILTHMRSTARMVEALFASEAIRRKIVYAPLGAVLPKRWQRHEPQASDEPIHLLFINSWSQTPPNFYHRGGLDVLEAFAILRERYPQLRLTLRSNLPPLAPYYHQILESGWVRVIERFLPAEEMAELHATSHIFLLPSARVHIVSLLQAMSYGLAVVASDGWGMDEYLTHERNGLIVKGRYGKVSWADEQAGQLREDYQPTYLPDAEVVQGLVEAVSRLVEDVALRRRLGQTARRDIETTFTPQRWNQGLKEALDKAYSLPPLSAEAQPPRVAAPNTCPEFEDTVMPVSGP